MPEKVVAKLTKEEVERSLRFIKEKRRIQQLMSKLLEKRAKLELEQCKFWEELGQKYGLIGGQNYYICHVTGELTEIDEEAEAESGND